jgi:hypothetical protein
VWYEIEPDLLVWFDARKRLNEVTEHAFNEIFAQRRIIQASSSSTGAAMS